MQLKIVVLPAPLGPISPWMRPASMAKLTRSTARSPPKLRARSWTASSIGPSLLGSPRGAPSARSGRKGTPSAPGSAPGLEGADATGGGWKWSRPEARGSARRDPASQLTDDDRPGRGAGLIDADPQRIPDPRVKGIARAILPRSRLAFG